MLKIAMLANLKKSLKKLKKVEDKWNLNCTDANPFQSSLSLKVPEEVTTKVVVAAMVAEAAVAAMEAADKNTMREAHPGAEATPSPEEDTVEAKEEATNSSLTSDQRLLALQVAVHQWSLERPEVKVAKDPWFTFPT